MLAFVYMCVCVRCLYHNDAIAAPSEMGQPQEHFTSTLWRCVHVQMNVWKTLCRHCCRRRRRRRRCPSTYTFTTSHHPDDAPHSSLECLQSQHFVLDSVRSSKRVNMGHLCTSYVCMYVRTWYTQRGRAFTRAWWPHTQIRCVRTSCPCSRRTQSTHSVPQSKSVSLFRDCYCYFCMSVMLLLLLLLRSLLRVVHVRT